MYVFVEVGGPSWPLVSSEAVEFDQRKRKVVKNWGRHLNPTDI